MDNKSEKIKKRQYDLKKEKLEKRNLEFQAAKGKISVLLLIVFIFILASYSHLMNSAYDSRKEDVEYFIKMEDPGEPYGLFGQQYLERGACRAMCVPPAAHHLLLGTSAYTMARALDVDELIYLYTNIDPISFEDNDRKNIVYTIFIFGIIFLLLAGITAIDYGFYFPSLKKFLPRFFLVNTSFVLVILGCIYFNSIIRGITLTADDIRGLFLFLLFMFFFFSFFYAIGFFVHALTRDIVKALLICGIIFAIIAFILHPYVNLYDGPHMSSEKNLPKRGTDEITGEVKAGNYEAYKKDKLETLKRFIDFENYYIGKKRRYFEDKVKNWRFFPTLFLIELVDNVACSSYVEHLDFYRFSIDMKNDYYTDFFEKDRFKVPPGTHSGFGFIEQKNHVFYSRSRVPDSYLVGLGMTILYTLVLILAAYFFIKPSYNRIAGKEIAEREEAERLEKEAYEKILKRIEENRVKQKSEE